MAARAEQTDHISFDDALSRARALGVGAFDEAGEPLAAFADFLSQAVRYRLSEDGRTDGVDNLVSRIGETWAFAGVRRKSETGVRLRSVQGDTWRDARLALEIVAPDRPFLIDSISAALAELGKTVAFFLNAVVDMPRGDDGGLDPQARDLVREAVIRIEMDPAADADEEADLRREIDAVLRDVALAVDDWEEMRARLASAIAQLERARLGNVSREKRRESVEFLKWMWDNKFAFLGVRRYEHRQSADGSEFVHAPNLDRGLLRDQSRRILGSTFLPDGSLAPAVRAFLESDETVVIAKANARSVVHRRTAMDYVGVKIFSADGRLVGEERFVGLFTSATYNRPASDIPLVRRKVSSVIENAGFAPGGHNESALLNILETFPRDELLQIDEKTLTDIAVGVLQLGKRPKTRLFLRRDRFDRFVSAIVYVPRDRFNSSVRIRVCELLENAHDGDLSGFTVYFGEGALARIHIIIDISGASGASRPDEARLEDQIEDIVRTWADVFVDRAREAHNGAPPRRLLARYQDAFPAGYQERTNPEQALADIEKIEDLIAVDGLRALRAFRLASDGGGTLRLKLYQRGEPVPLSDFLPTIENMGLRLLMEAGFPVRPFGDDQPVWIHEFEAEERLGRPIDLEGVREKFEAACLAVLDGASDDDDFNGLVLSADIHWRDAAMLRACAKFQIQSGFPFSMDYMASALMRHPETTRRVVDLFHARFRPDRRSPEARAEETDSLVNDVFGRIERIASLDEDRILRRFANLVLAVQRTNFFQKDANGAPKPAIAFKIASRMIEELPEPKPYREIFVSSPEVDGVHLRFGPVARGGLRWSDRKEDYRTEVLDLVKAQQVKNAVIVPVGSKGGFYPRRLPENGDRDAIFTAGRDAYKTFIGGLLDVTDNLIDGELAHPDAVVVHDGADPYLVVAADKGTATFSDTANAIATGRGFWLGDAFASGGSAGYDHKAMGITARGAWEAVKRHFREMGVDIQTETFTAAGVGDMSGDVFGNGMLLSKTTKLVAAFDHRDIFIDPDPDPDASWTERKRLFEAGRTSWADYDKSVLSAGGGVWSRQGKSVSLSDEARALLGVEAESLPPNEVIKAILKMPVDLFWMGGIGTYYKAEAEENWRVGDRSNDAVRVDVEDCRAQVIGEGANLGLTQDARIAFASRGGRINTDAIDNSAGVDSSDHEVNIKILVARAIERGDLQAADRDALLASMTDDVADHVLRHNYAQTRALSMMEATADQDVDSCGRFMAALEREGRLDREIEHLPSNEELAERKSRGDGLTRPELAVLMAYAKIWLFDELLASELVDDPYFDDELRAYFPDALQRFDGAMAEHRLRREIVATRLSNEIVDTCGLTFAYRSAEATGASYRDIAAAYEASRRILDLGGYAEQIDALDNVADADVQLRLYIDAADLLRKQCYRIIRGRSAAARRGVANTIARYRDRLGALIADVPDLLTPDGRKDFDDREARLTEAGVPTELARRAASATYLIPGVDILDLAEDAGWSAAAAGALYFRLESFLGLDALRAAASPSRLDEHFDRLALRRILEDLSFAQARIARCAVAACGNGDAVDPAETAPTDAAERAVAAFRRRHGAAVNRYAKLVADLDLSAGALLGKMTLAARHLEELGDATAPQTEDRTGR